MSCWEITSDNRLMENMHESALHIERPLCSLNEIRWSGNSSPKSNLDEPIPHQKEVLEVYLNYEI